MSPTTNWRGDNVADNDIARIVASIEKRRRKWKKRALRAERYSYELDSAVTNVCREKLSGRNVCEPVVAALERGLARKESDHARALGTCRDASQRWRGHLPSEVPSELWEEYKTEVLGIQPKGDPPR